MALSETGQKALELFKSGQDPMQAVEDGPSGPYEESDPQPVNPGEVPGIATEAFNAPSGDEADSQSAKPEVESGETLEASTESEDVEEDEAQLSSEENAEPDTEIVTVTDHTGKRKKIKIDYTDRNSIKKAHQMMAGARKWQVERDQERSWRTENAPKVENWDRLEKIFSEEGSRGLINFLEDDPEAFSRLVDEDLARRNASPEELAEYQRQDEERARTRREEDFERRQNELAEREEAIETQRLESQINPAFDRYRFAGKLGDEDQEHMLDEMVWNNALKKLEDYPEDTELTQAMIDREFRNVAMKVRKLVNTEAQKQTKKIVKQKKAKAAEQTQIAAKKGMGAERGAAEIRDSIRSGNVAGILSNILRRGV